MNLGGPLMRPLFLVYSLLPMNHSGAVRYWREARSPRYSLSLAFPLLLLYEILAVTLSHGELSGVRNGADVLLKSLFVMLGGRDGLAVFGVLLVGGGAVLACRDYRREKRIDPRYFAWMTMESIAYAMLFGVVAGTLTMLLLPGLSLVGVTGFLGSVSQEDLSVPTRLMISMGAGIYEELLFRVILVSGLGWLATTIFGWSATRSSVWAVVLGALLFAAFHYLGPYGDRLALGSFVFRTVAGLLFSGLYLLRGFGITAWTHALYDVLFTVG